MTDKTAELREAKLFDDWFKEMLEHGGLLNRDRYVAFQCFVNLPRYLERLSAPEGWQLVPKEADENMLQAGHQTNKNGSLNAPLKKIFRHMLAAAPNASPTQGDVEQPACELCGAGPFPDLRSWAGHKCDRTKREALAIERKP